MTTLEAIVNNTTYNLSLGEPFALIDSDDGMAPVQRITTQGPQQHGDTDIDFRLDALSWPLGLLMYASSIAEHYTNRKLALRIFRPSRVPIQMRWTLDNGDVRQIDCHVNGKMTFGSRERRGFAQRFVVPLRAANPTFYDPDRKFVSFGIAVSGSVFGFPIGFAISFGEASSIDTTKTIAYAGSWREYPVIEIAGPLTNPVITNLSTGDVLDLTGTTVALGDTYTIDCRPGYKSVKDAAGVNRIAALSDTSDLASFSLEADPDVSGGLNDIRVTGTSATSATQIYLRYYERYLGI